jgi:hypothetical protein
VPGHDFPWGSRYRAVHRPPVEAFGARYEAAGASAHRVRLRRGARDVLILPRESSLGKAGPRAGDRDRRALANGASEMARGLGSGGGGNREASERLVSAIARVSLHSPSPSPYPYPYPYPSADRVASARKIMQADGPRIINTR